MQADALLNAFKGLRLLVVGDLMLDVDLRLKFGRKSEEFEGCIYEEQERAYYPGGAANVAQNCAALGARVTLTGGALAASGTGQRLRQACSAAASLHYRYAFDAPPWSEITTKTRCFLGSQFLHRVDRDVQNPLGVRDIETLLDDAAFWGERYDALLLSDYRKGCFAEAGVVQGMVRAFKRHNPAGIAGINPKPQTLVQVPACGIDLMTVNNREYLQIAGPYEKPGPLLRRLGVPLLLHTDGSRGLRLYHESGREILAMVDRVASPDVVGCGDAAFAAAVLTRTVTDDLGTIAQTAAAAGTCKAARRGTVPVTAEALLARLAPREVTCVA